MHSVPNKSDAWRRIRRLRSELVSSLFLQRGSFWESVSKTRARRKIRPEVGVPPADFDGPTQLAQNEETLELLEEFIPEHVRRTTTGVWQLFLESCLLYDPPGGRLVEFAEFATPAFFSALGFEGELTAVDIPPIVKITNPDGTVRRLIEVDEHTTDEELRRALRFIRRLEGAPEKQEPRGRDPLVCIDLAIRYEQGEVDPEDSRRRTVTHESLAKERELSKRQVKAYIEEGRQLLKNNPRPEE